MPRPPLALLVRVLTTTLLVCAAPVAPRADGRPQSEQTARTTVAHASRSCDAGRYAAARAQFERALGQARAEHDGIAEAQAQRGIGLALYRQAKYPAAREALLAALRLFETLEDHAGAGWTLHHVGWLAYDYDSDVRPDVYWSRGLEHMQAAGDRAGEAQLLSDRAAALRPGPESVAAFQRALQLARDAGATRTAGETLFRMGQHQFWVGSYAAAIDTFQQALDVFVRIGARDWEADVYLQLARLHEHHGRRDRAAELYGRGLAILQQLEDKARTADALSAIVAMHRAAGQLPQAVAAARKALALRETIDGTRSINLERLRLAWIYIEMGRPREALPLVDAVMRGPDAFSRSLGYPPLAETYLGLGDYRRAHDAATEAVRLVRETAERPFLLTTRARAADKLGDRPAALADVDAALGQVEDARTQLVPSDLMRQGYGERLEHMFAFAVELRMRSGRAEAALEATEQARARAFLDLLAARPGSEAAGDDRSAATATPASIEQLAATARRLGSTIVSYWVAPAETFIWVIDGNGRVTSASVRASARRLAVLIERTSAEPGIAGPFAAEPWRELYDTLVRPVEHALPDGRGKLLTIVPHGPLFRLSFAALLDRRHTYFIERYRLHYVPSGGSLLYLQSRPGPAHGTERYLFVADPAGAAPSAQAAPVPLPGAVREMAAIVGTLPAGAATTLSGSRATEERLRSLLPGQTVVHLATHGRLSDAPGADSFLTLNGSGTNTANDGRLTTEEIYDLRLDADLVVLSACRSARGPVTGDGVLGMTRAFLYAGAPSIVATLWDVADRSGPELMPAFYRRWRLLSDKSAALREAQLELIARLRAGRVKVDTPGGVRTLPEHPFLWAPYILVGEI